MKTSLILRLLIGLAALTLGPALVQAQGFTDEEIANSASINDLDSPPKPVKQSPPDVPRDLRGVQASVQVGFVIDEKGNVTAPRVIKSSNDAVNQVALECVSKWSFEPGKRDGVPVAVRVVVPLRFK